ncbi:MAG: IS5 family transposase [Gammaproteobacteria bacterium]|nr:IS5 family transposase [Gammaproteobacteria bacterium]
MEMNNLGNRLFNLVNTYLAENGLKVNRGTIVDATIINAPTSTKNKEKSRDPDMHQTRKWNQWYFGMKAHIGVDSQTKLIHSVAVTPANVHDSQVLEDLLHGDETKLWGDLVYAGQKKKLYEHAPNTKDYTQKKGSRHRQLTERKSRFTLIQNIDRKTSQCASEAIIQLLSPFSDQVHTMVRTTVRTTEKSLLTTKI